MQSDVSFWFDDILLHQRKWIDRNWEQKKGNRAAWQPWREAKVVAAGLKVFLTT